MADPATATTAASLAAAVSGVTLAMLGVDYYSLLYGMVGAFLALGSTETMGRGKAVVYVVLSTIVGAALGNLAVLVLAPATQARAPLIVGCMLGGYGAQALASTLLKAALKRIDAIGGSPAPGGDGK